MRPALYYYNDTDKGYELYLGRYSTIDGLALLGDRAMSIQSFGATSYKRFGWATEDDIPELKSAGAAIEFLKSEFDIGLVEFEALVDDSDRFSSHDDTECHFIFRARGDCIDLMSSANTTTVSRSAY